MKPVSNETLLQQLRWRYATKRFDPSRKIPADDWAALEQALVLSPSSFGMQPWKFLVITEPALKEKLVPVSWDQAQVADCSHLVVFAIKKHICAEDVDTFVARVAEVRGTTASALDSYRKMMMGSLVEAPFSFNVNEWAARQVYIALGNFMTSAALLGIDTCPLEGLDPGQYDAILGLSKRRLATVVACAAGYRGMGDKYATLPKVRFKPEDVIERI